MVSRGNWCRRETGVAGKLMSRGNWCRRETGVAGKLISQENWFPGFAVTLVSQGHLFLVTLAKIFVIILVEKQITYNAKVSDTTIL